MHGNWLKSIGEYRPQISFQMFCIVQIAGRWMFRWTSFRRKFSSMNWERVLLPNSGDQSVSVFYQLIAKLIFESIMLGLWDGEQLRFKLFQVGAPWVTLMVWSQFDEEDLLQQNVHLFPILLITIFSFQRGWGFHQGGGEVAANKWFAKVSLFTILR